MTSSGPALAPVGEPAIASGLKVEAGARGNDRCATMVDGVDDLASVDPLQVDRGDHEMGVLALDDRQRDAFVCHLDCVGVAELMRREAAAHPGLRREMPQLSSGARR